MMVGLFEGKGGATVTVAWLHQTILRWLFVLAAVAISTSAFPTRAVADEVIVMRVQGAIGPATVAYLADGFEQAQQSDAALIIIALDTPGGLDTSMREIIREILASPVAVATYVHPSGARAASAGTFILYASHFAAMTPGTNLGAATPIQIGAIPAPDKADQDDKEEPTAGTALERKMVNDAAAYIRSLAEMRGRNADWAEEAVRSAASLSAQSALEQGVIDLVAPDVSSLIAQLDGREYLIDGKSRAIATVNLTVREIEPDWATEILATITNPNIALILMMIGLYGLIFEFLNPGALVPGTIGAISLLIGLYALAVLPVDFVGVALIVLGVGLMVAEAFAPSFGILGIGGVVSFIFGATIMFDTDVPEFRVDSSIIAALGIFSAGLIMIVSRVSIRSFKRRIVTGAEELVGATATVLDWSEGEGHVFVHSERWNARGPAELKPDDRVAIDSIKGLNLSVSPHRRAHQEVERN